MNKTIQKSLLLISLLLTGLPVLKAQTTAELRYDFGRHIYNDLRWEKPVEIRLRHISTDKWGRNYGYVMLNPAAEQLHNMEIRLQRDLKFVESPLALRMEYHAGMRYAERVTHALSAGLSYRFHNEYVDLTIAPAYRHDFGQLQKSNFQLWGDASWTSWNRCWTVEGFFVLRTDPRKWEKVILRAEPQLWCHLNQFVGVSDQLNLSLGTELRVDYNTLVPGSLHIRPSLAARWTF